MTLTKRERAELERPVGTRTGRADAARRARLLLLLADGHTWAEIRGKIGMGLRGRIPSTSAIRLASARRTSLTVRSA